MDTRTVVKKDSMITVCSSDFPFNSIQRLKQLPQTQLINPNWQPSPSLNTAWVEPQLPQRKSEAVMLQQSFPGARAEASCTIPIEGNLDDKTKIKHLTCTVDLWESWGLSCCPAHDKFFDLRHWLPELFPQNTAYGPEVVGLSQWNWDARAQNRRNLGCSEHWSREGWYVCRLTLRISDDDDDDDYAIGTSVALNMK